MTLTGELMRFTIPVNMAGLPAMSIPIGLSSAGNQIINDMQCSATLYKQSLARSENH